MSAGAQRKLLDAPMPRKILEPIFFRDVLLTKGCWKRQKNQQQKGYLEAIMDAKWNKVIDNLSVRATLLVLGFGAWLAISYSLLSW